MSKREIAIESYLQMPAFAHIRLMNMRLKVSLSAVDKCNAFVTLLISTKIIYFEI